MIRLYEKKDHLIRKNPNLTDGQKQEIMDLLAKHPSSENKIDWTRNSKLTYEDFLDVLRPLYINDLDFRGLVESKDYDLLLDKPNEKLYFIHTYNASKIIASNAVEPKIWTKIPSWCGEEEFTDEAHAFGYFDSEHGDMKPGAKWCISMQTSDRYWKKYEEDFLFFFWFRDGEYIPDPNKKIAIGIDRDNGKVILKYNGADTDINSELPLYIEELIKEFYSKRDLEKKKDIKKQRLLKEFTLNPSTNRYDYEWSLDTSDLKYLISEDGNGFTINFGVIKGGFYCQDLGLTSLKGAPQTVDGDFNCSYNELTSLEGAPQEVGGHFSCISNKLTSLEGAPQTVGGWFDCSYTELTSLEGAPKIVGKNFYCVKNKLTSLEGAPREVGGDFDCQGNQLTSLKGAPQNIGGDFYCNSNQLTSLEGAPQIIKGNFWCTNNPNLHSLEGLGEVKGKIFKDFF